MPSCAVIIVAWNCWDHLFRCLDALERQTCDDFRVIVVNNGNASLEQEQRLERYARLHYQRSPANLGFAAGNNRGIALAGDCRWIALLNPDTIPAPDWLEKMLLAAERNPDFHVLGSLLLQAADPGLLDGEGDCYHISGFVWRKGLGLPVEAGDGTPWEAFSPCAAAALYRADALREAGGFDEDFFCYVEDVDLGFRLRLAGHRCLIVPDARVLHVGSATTVRRSPFYVYHGHRNLVWAYVKNMPGVLFWLFLPFHIGMNLAGVLRYMLRGQTRVVLRAKYDALTALPVVWRKRRSIQRRRVVGPGEILKAMDTSLVPGGGNNKKLRGREVNPA